MVLLKNFQKVNAIVALLLSIISTCNSHYSLRNQSLDKIEDHSTSITNVVGEYHDGVISHALENKPHSVDLKRQTQHRFVQEPYIKPGLQKDLEGGSQTKANVDPGVHEDTKPEKNGDESNAVKVIHNLDVKNNTSIMADKRLHVPESEINKHAESVRHGKDSNLTNIEKKVPKLANTSTTSVDMREPSKMASKKNSIDDNDNNEANREENSMLEFPALSKAAESLPPKGYNRQFLPKPVKGPVDVQLRVLLQHIYSINQIEKIITVGIRIFMMWHDPRLRYNKSILPQGIDGIPVDPNDIWIPHVEILNVVEKSIMHESITIYPSGIVFFVSRIKCDVTVAFEVKWFPFDRQNFLIEFGTFGYSKDLVWLNTENTNWEPAFHVDAQKAKNIGNMLSSIVNSNEIPVNENVNKDIAKMQTVQQSEEHFDTSRDSNFLLGSNILANREQQSYWVVDSFSGWQSIRDGEGARYSFVGVNALLQMHRGRFHFILAYVVPLVFIITVSEANFFFDVRDLEPRISIAAALLLCMVAFQYTIEQEIPRVSYPVWINWYLVGCYTFIVAQVFFMVITLLIAGRRKKYLHKRTRKGFSESSEDELEDEYQINEYSHLTSERKTPIVSQEEIAQYFNHAVAICYPVCFGLFNLAMFYSIPA